MARSLQSFLNNIQKTGVRTQNMWELEVYSGYDDVDEALQDVTLYIQGFTAPNRTQEYADVPYKAYPIPVPTHMTMENEHSLTIRADINGNIRKAFMKWQSYMTDPAIGNGSVFGGDRRIPKNSYVRLHLLGADMETVVETYRIVGVSVANVGNLEVSNEAADVTTFEVGLRSVYWEIESTTDKFQGIK